MQSCNLLSIMVKDQCISAILNKSFKVVLSTNLTDDHVPEKLIASRPLINVLHVYF